MSSSAYMPDDMPGFPFPEPAVDHSMDPFRRLALAVFDRAREDRDVVIPAKKRCPKPVAPQGLYEGSTSFKKRVGVWETRRRKYVKYWSERESQQDEAGAFILERDTLWHDLLADVLPGRKNGSTNGNGQPH